MNTILYTSNLCSFMSSLSFFKRSELLTVSISIEARILDVENALVWLGTAQIFIFNNELGTDNLKSALRITGNDI